MHALKLQASISSLKNSFIFSFFFLTLSSALSSSTIFLYLGNIRYKMFNVFLFLMRERMEFVRREDFPLNGFQVVKYNHLSLAAYRARILEEYFVFILLRSGFE